MMPSLLILLYRGLAVIAVLSPVIINIILKGDITISLIYSPLLSLSLTILFIYADKKVQQLAGVLINKMGLSMMYLVKNALGLIGKKKGINTKPLNTTKVHYIQKFRCWASGVGC
jgi:hypothetical protein